MILKRLCHWIGGWENRPWKRLFAPLITGESCWFSHHFQDYEHSEWHSWLCYIWKKLPLLTRFPQDKHSWRWNHWGITPFSCRDVHYTHCQGYGYKVGHQYVGQDSPLNKLLVSTKTSLWLMVDTTSLLRELWVLTIVGLYQLGLWVFNQGSYPEKKKVMFTNKSRSNKWVPHLPWNHQPVVQPLLLLINPYY